MGSVTVLTRDMNTMPVAGIPVVVNDASGAIVVVTKTTSDGTVEVSVPKGGSVSAFQSQGLWFDVTSVVDPPDAATVRFTIYQPTPPDPELIAPNDETVFNLAMQQVPAGTTEVQILGCRGKVVALAPSYQVIFSNTACPVQSTSSFFAIAIDEQGLPLAWATELDVPNSPGKTVDVQIPLSHKDVDTVSASGESIPAGFADLTVQVLPDAPSFPGFASYWRASPSNLNSTYSQTFVLPHAAFGSYHLFEAAGAHSGGPIGSGFSRDRTYSTSSNSSTWDLSSIAQVSANPLDLSDTTHPQATWSVGAGSRGDYGTAILQWSGGTASAEYDVYFPADHPTSYRIPDVPPELSGYAPTATSTFDGVWVGYTDDERADGYEGTTLFRDLAPVDGLGTVKSSAYNRTLP